MAFFETHFFSPTLCFGTDINVFIPTPNSDELLNNKKSDYFKDGARFQVLYLLHGAYGDYTDWMRLTSIERYAQDHKLAVIMPSASNSFYQDMKYGSDYLTYLTEELPRMCQSLFPISKKRENTFVAGLSMGGYGALKLALTKPEMFSCAVSLSGAINAAETISAVKAGNVSAPFDYEAIFGSTKIEGTDADLFALIKKHKEEGIPLPKIFQSVGTGDFIYAANVSARRKLEELGVDLTYEEHPGIHDWIYWDTHIQRALDWLPLKNDSVEE